MLRELVLLLSAVTAIYAQRRLSLPDAQSCASSKYRALALVSSLLFSLLGRIRRRVEAVIA